MGTRNHRRASDTKAAAKPGGANTSSITYSAAKRLVQRLKWIGITAKIEAGSVSRRPIRVSLSKAIPQGIVAVYADPSGSAVPVTDGVSSKRLGKAIEYLLSARFEERLRLTRLLKRSIGYPRCVRRRKSDCLP